MLFFFALERFFATLVVFAFFLVVCFFVCEKEGKTSAVAKNNIRSRFIYIFKSRFIKSVTLTWLYLSDTEV